VLEMEGDVSGHVRRARLSAAAPSTWMWW
jgi:hypothetical protein